MKRASRWIVVAALFVAQAPISAFAEDQNPLALRGAEMSLEISLDVQDETLGQIFAAISKRSGAQFDVSSEVSALRASLSVENVPLRSVLELLAKNLRLVYVAEVDRVRVELRPRDDPRAPNYTFAFETVAGGQRQRWPLLGLRAGLCGLLQQRFREAAVYSLHHEVPVIEQRHGGDQLSVVYCIEGESSGQVRFLLDVTVLAVSEDGYAERTERRLVRKAIAVGAKTSLVFASKDDLISVSVIDLVRSKAHAGRP